jgi:uncharacterized protein
MALTFSNRFLVPLPFEQAWRTILDVQTVVTCLPGANLTKVIDDRTFEGTVDVRLGPVALSFGGTAKIIEATRETGRILMHGDGNERRARGQASADFDINLKAIDDSKTEVTVESSVNLVGAIAQYGRGTAMMKAVADEILNRFAANLREAITQQPRSAPSEPSAHPTPPSNKDRGLPLGSIIWSAFCRWLRGLWPGSHPDRSDRS